MTSDRLIVSARPRFEIEGEEKSRLTTDLIRLDVWHDEDGLSRLEAVLRNWGRPSEDEGPTFVYFDGSILDLGKRIVVHAGGEDDEVTIFDGKITALAGRFPNLQPPELRVLAEDALQIMRMRERTRFYEQQDESGIVSTIASDHGLSGNAEAQGTQHKQMWQVNQNDLAFLRERARAADARIGVDGSDLLFKPRRGGGGGDPIRLSKEAELLHFEAIADLSHQRKEVHVHGWSVSDKEGIHESASSSDVDGEANGGRTGPQVLDDAGWEAIEHLHLETPATSGEAQALARSIMLRRARRFLFGRGTTHGTPALSVGSEVELLDVGDWFNGRWTICAVRHAWSITEGLRTHFSAERVDMGEELVIALDPKGPVLPAPANRLFGVYVALVTSVKDADSQGRVEVKLPWVDDTDGGRAKAWARLSTMNAGNNRGTWFIPEVDDEVLISFIAGDPRWPVVVGALWNGSDAPPETMDGGGKNNVRSVTSRSGHKLTFDDSSGAEVVTVTTQGGHTLKLDDASGGKIQITHSGGAQVEIDSSGTVKITALNEVKIDAPAGLKVTAAQVTVDAGFSKFSGVVKADTVITNAVVSSSYTPGAGNVW